MIVSALGLVAFWLYSVALGRTDVASSTAPLIVMQTCIPAVVGVVAFGDTVRDGWAVAVVAGSSSPRGCDPSRSRPPGV